MLHWSAFRAARNRFSGHRWRWPCSGSPVGRPRPRLVDMHGNDTNRADAASLGDINARGGTRQRIGCREGRIRCDCPDRFHGIGGANARTEFEDATGLAARRIDIEQNTGDGWIRRVPHRAWRRFRHKTSFPRRLRGPGCVAPGFRGSESRPDRVAYLFARGFAEWQSGQGFGPADPFAENGR